MKEKERKVSMDENLRQGSQQNKRGKKKRQGKEVRKELKEIALTKITIN